MEATVANRKQVAIRTADTGTAAAAVEAARARLEAAQVQLSYTSIAAPIDGTVTRKSVLMGSIRPQELNQIQRGFLIEQRHQIDAVERRHDDGPGVLVLHRSRILL